jgi:3-hydroxyisobutyryl-CoA hydrolase
MAGDSCLEVVYRMYWLCYHIHSYKKTQVALVHGITMGGGASLMAPMKFSVVTDKTVSIFATSSDIFASPTNKQHMTKKITLLHAQR